jgi:hypothetical protein
VRFRYDPEVFSSGVQFDADTIIARLRELAFLNSSAALGLRLQGGSAKGGRKGKQQQGTEEVEVIQHSNGSNVDAPGSATPTSSSSSAGGLLDLQQIATGLQAQAAAPSDPAAPAAAGAAVAMPDGLQVFHYEGGLAEYVTW